MVLIFILAYFEWRDTENQQFRRKCKLRLKVIVSLCTVFALQVFFAWETRSHRYKSLDRKRCFSKVENSPVRGELRKCSTLFDGKEDWCSREDDHNEDKKAYLRFKDGKSKSSCIREMVRAYLLCWSGLHLSVEK